MKDSRMFSLENLPPWDGIPRLCAWLDSAKPIS